MNSKSSVISLGCAVAIRTELVGNAMVGWFETPVLRLGESEFVPIEAIERLTAPPAVESRDETEQPLLLTQTAASKRLGVSEPVLRRLVRNGDIRTTPITTGRSYVAVSELERYIADNSHRGGN